MHNHNALSKAVRVTVPVSIAGNLDKFKGVIEQTLGRLGCPACCSGFDIFIANEREFVFDKQRIANASVAARATSAGPRVGLTLAQGAGSDIKSVFNGIDQLADRLGCRACCSGFDLLLRSNLEFFADPGGQLNDVPGL